MSENVFLPAELVRSQQAVVGRTERLLEAGVALVSLQRTRTGLIFSIAWYRWPLFLKLDSAPDNFQRRAVKRNGRWTVVRTGPTGWWTGGARSPDRGGTALWVWVLSWAGTSQLVGPSSRPTQERRRGLVGVRRLRTGSRQTSRCPTSSSWWLCWSCRRLPCAPCLHHLNCTQCRRLSLKYPPRFRTGLHPPSQVWTITRWSHRPCPQSTYPCHRLPRFSQRTCSPLPPSLHRSLPHSTPRPPCQAVRDVDPDLQQNFTSDSRRLTNSSELLRKRERRLKQASPGRIRERRWECSFL